MTNKKMHTGTNVNLKCENGKHVNGGTNKEKEYRKELKELEIEKSEDEPLTEQELRRIFICMQESLFAGS